MKGKIISLTLLFLIIAVMGFVNPFQADVTRYKGFYGTLLLYDYDSTGTCSGHTVADAGHTMQYKVDNGSWTDCTVTNATGSYQYTPSDSGVHNMYVRAKPQCNDSIQHHQPCVINGFSYPYHYQSINNKNFGATIRTYACTTRVDRRATWKPGTQ
jgi:hypothetical protein